MVNPFLSIITLKVNGFNSPTKRNRMAEWLKTANHPRSKYVLSRRNSLENLKMSEVISPGTNTV